MTPPFPRNLLYLAVLSLFLFAPAALAARLEAEFTWNTSNYGLRFDVMTEPQNELAYHRIEWGGFPTAPCGGGQPQSYNSIPGSSWTNVPCGGYGPVTFSVDPLYATTLYFNVQMWQAPRDYHLENGYWVSNPPEPVTVTMHLRIDGTEVAQATLPLSAWDNGHTILTYTPNLTGSVFDLTDTSEAKERRVLISNTHDANNAPLAAYPFFQSILARDGVMPIGLRTYVNGVATSGIPVTLRVLDPPDPSAYIVGAPGGQPAPGTALSHNDDNVGTLPTLSGTGVTSNGDGTYSVTSTDNGYVFAELHLDPSARPGDNYRVEATSTGTPTATSGLMTVWRRMYFEKRLMFRKGNPMVTDTPAGVWHVVVPNTSIATVTENFAAGNHIVLLHAPKRGEAKPAGSFYKSFNTISQATTFTAPSPATAAGTGTLTLVAGSTTINGSGTRFSRLTAESATTIGTVINVGTERFVVIAINSNTQMTVAPAPQTGGTGLAYTTGDAQLAPSTSYVRLTLSNALTQPFYKDSLPTPRQNSNLLNDAVAKIAASGTIGATDYFDADDAFLVESYDHPSNAMQAAYAEYLPLPLNPTPVPRATLSKVDGTLSQAFIDKWFESPTPRSVTNPTTDALLNFHYQPPANHQLVLVGEDSPDGDAGQTYQRVLTLTDRESATVLFRGKIESHVTQTTSSLFQQNVDAILRKVEVHEIAHQWRVNPTGTGGHCQRVQYDSTAGYPTQQTPPAAPAPGTLFCEMAVDSLTMPAPWNPNQLINQAIHQYGNSSVSFHMILTNNVWDSEYLTLRRAADPFQP